MPTSCRPAIIFHVTALPAGYVTGTLRRHFGAMVLKPATLSYELYSNNIQEEEKEEEEI